MYVKILCVLEKMEDAITPRPQKIPFAKKKAKNMILKVLLVFMVVAAAALCPREVPSAGNPLHRYRRVFVCLR